MVSQRRPADPKVIDGLIGQRLVASARAVARAATIPADEKRRLADELEAAVDACRESAAGGGDRG